MAASSKAKGPHSKDNNGKQPLLLTKGKIELHIGMKIEAMDYQEKWYPSRIVKINVEKKEVLVHFDKWSARFDVWLHKDSPKLRMIRTPGNKVKEKEWRVGDRIIAKWGPAGKIYPARISKILNETTVEVSFYDGFKKHLHKSSLKRDTEKLYRNYVGGHNINENPLVLSSSTTSTTGDPIASLTDSNRGRRRHTEPAAMTDFVTDMQKKKVNRISISEEVGASPENNKSRKISASKPAIISTKDDRNDKTKSSSSKPQSSKQSSPSKDESSTSVHDTPTSITSSLKYGKETPNSLKKEISAHEENDDATDMKEEATKLMIREVPDTVRAQTPKDKAKTHVKQETADAKIKAIDHATVSQTKDITLTTQQVTKLHLRNRTPRTPITTQPRNKTPVTENVSKIKNKTPVTQTKTEVTNKTPATQTAKTQLRYKTLVTQTSTTQPKNEILVTQTATAEVTNKTPVTQTATQSRNKTPVAQTATTQLKTAVTQQTKFRRPSSSSSTSSEKRKTPIAINPQNKREWRVGDRILSKWGPAGKIYPARIAKVINENVVEIHFYDGFKKTVTKSALKPDVEMLAEGRGHASDLDTRNIHDNSKSNSKLYRNYVGGLNIKEKYEPLNPLFPKTFTKVEIDPALLNTARAKRRHTEPAAMNDFVTSTQKKNTRTSLSDGPGANTNDNKTGKGSSSELLEPPIKKVKKEVEAPGAVNSTKSGKTKALTRTRPKKENKGALHETESMVSTRSTRGNDVIKGDTENDITQINLISDKIFKEVTGNRTRSRKISDTLLPDRASAEIMSSSETRISRSSKEKNNDKIISSGKPSRLSATLKEEADIETSNSPKGGGLISTESTKETEINQGPEVTTRSRRPSEFKKELESGSKEERKFDENTGKPATITEGKEPKGKSNEIKPKSRGLISKTVSIKETLLDYSGNSDLFTSPSERSMEESSTTSSVSTRSKTEGEIMTSHSALKSHPERERSPVKTRSTNSRKVSADETFLKEQSPTEKFLKANTEDEKTVDKNVLPPIHRTRSVSHSALSSMENKEISSGSSGDLFPSSKDSSRLKKRRPSSLTSETISVKETFVVSPSEANQEENSKHSRDEVEVESSKPSVEKDKEDEKEVENIEEVGDEAFHDGESSRPTTRYVSTLPIQSVVTDKKTTSSASAIQQKQPISTSLSKRRYSLPVRLPISRVLRSEKGKLKQSKLRLPLRESLEKSPKAKDRLSKGHYSLTLSLKLSERIKTKTGTSLKQEVKEITAMSDCPAEVVEETRSKTQTVIEDDKNIEKNGEIEESEGIESNEDIKDNGSIDQRKEIELEKDTSDDKDKQQLTEKEEFKVSHEEKTEIVKVEQEENEEKVLHEEEQLDNVLAGNEVQATDESKSNTSDNLPPIKLTIPTSLLQKPKKKKKKKRTSLSPMQKDVQDILGCSDSSQASHITSEVVSSTQPCGDDTLIFPLSETTTDVKNSPEKEIVKSKKQVIKLIDAIEESGRKTEENIFLEENENQAKFKRPGGNNEVQAIFKEKSLSEQAEDKSMYYLNLEKGQKELPEINKETKTVDENKSMTEPGEELQQQELVNVDIEVEKNHITEDYVTEKNRRDTDLIEETTDEGKAMDVIEFKVNSRNATENEDVMVKKEIDESELSEVSSSKLTKDQARKNKRERSKADISIRDLVTENSHSTSQNDDVTVVEESEVDIKAYSAEEKSGSGNNDIDYLNNEGDEDDHLIIVEEQEVNSKRSKDKTEAPHGDENNEHVLNDVEKEFTDQAVMIDDHEKDISSKSTKTCTIRLSDITANLSTVDASVKETKKEDEITKKDEQTNASCTESKLPISDEVDQINEELKETFEIGQARTASEQDQNEKLRDEQSVVLNESKAAKRSLNSSPNIEIIKKQSKSYVMFPTIEEDNFTKGSFLTSKKEAKVESKDAINLLETASDKIDLQQYLSNEHKQSPAKEEDSSLKLRPSTRNKKKQTEKIETVSQLETQKSKMTAKAASIYTKELVPPAKTETGKVIYGKLHIFSQLENERRGPRKSYSKYRDIKTENIHKLKTVTGKPSKESLLSKYTTRKHQIQKNVSEKVTRGKSATKKELPLSKVEQKKRSPEFKQASKQGTPKERLSPKTESFLTKLETARDNMEPVLLSNNDLRATDESSKPEEKIKEEDVKENEVKTVEKISLPTETLNDYKQSEEDSAVSAKGMVEPDKKGDEVKLTSQTSDMQVDIGIQDTSEKTTSAFAAVSPKRSTRSSFSKYRKSRTTEGIKQIVKTPTKLDPVSPVLSFKDRRMIANKKNLTKSPLSKHISSIKIKKKTKGEKIEPSKKDDEIGSGGKRKFEDKYELFKRKWKAEKERRRRLLQQAEEIESKRKEATDIDKLKKQEQKIQQPVTKQVTAEESASASEEIKNVSVLEDQKTDAGLVNSSLTGTPTLETGSSEKPIFVEKEDSEDVESSSPPVKTGPKIKRTATSKEKIATINEEMLSLRRRGRPSKAVIVAREKLKLREKLLRKKLKEKMKLEAARGTGNVDSEMSLDSLKGIVQKKRGRPRKIRPSEEDLDYVPSEEEARKLKPLDTSRTPNEDDLLSQASMVQDERSYLKRKPPCAIRPFMKPISHSQGYRPQYIIQPPFQFTPRFNLTATQIAASKIQKRVKQQKLQSMQAEHFLNIRLPPQLSVPLDATVPSTSHLQSPFIPASSAEADESVPSKSRLEEMDDSDTDIIVVQPKEITDDNQQPGAIKTPGTSQVDSKTVELDLTNIKLESSGSTSYPQPTKKRKSVDFIAAGLSNKKKGDEVPEEKTKLTITGGSPSTVQTSPSSSAINLYKSPAVVLQKISKTQRILPKPAPASSGLSVPLSIQMPQLANLLAQKPTTLKLDEVPKKDKLKVEPPTSTPSDITSPQPEKMLNLVEKTSPPSTLSRSIVLETKTKVILPPMSPTTAFPTQVSSSSSTQVHVSSEVSDLTKEASKAEDKSNESKDINALALVGKKKKKKRRLEKEDGTYEFRKHKKRPKLAVDSKAVSGTTQSILDSLPLIEYKCTEKNCTKTFRKSHLLEYHLKYFHTIKPSPKRTRASISVSSNESITPSPLAESARNSETSSQRSYSHSEYSSESDESEADNDIEELLSVDDCVKCVCEDDCELGFMIQCEQCFTWQHGECVGYSQQKSVPLFYLCHVCSNPKGLRKSQMYSNDYTWYRHGKPPLVKSCRNEKEDLLKTVDDENDEVMSSIILTTHGMMTELYNIRDVLQEIRNKYVRMNSPNNDELLKWRQEKFSDIVELNGTTNGSNGIISKEHAHLDKMLENIFREKHSQKSDDDKNAIPEKAYTEGNIFPKIETSNVGKNDGTTNSVFDEQNVQNQTVSSTEGPIENAEITERRDKDCTSEDITRESAVVKAEIENRDNQTLSVSEAYTNNKQDSIDTTQNPEKNGRENEVSEPRFTLNSNMSETLIEEPSGKSVKNESLINAINDDEINTTNASFESTETETETAYTDEDSIPYVGIESESELTESSGQLHENGKNETKIPQETKKEKVQSELEKTDNSACEKLNFKPFQCHGIDTLNIKKTDLTSETKENLIARYYILCEIEKIEDEITDRIKEMNAKLDELEEEYNNIDRSREISSHLRSNFKMPDMKHLMTQLHKCKWEGILKTSNKVPRAVANHASVYTKPLQVHSTTT